MGLTGAWAMSEGKSTSGNLKFVGLTKLSYSAVGESGMDIESDNHRKPLAFTAQKIRFTTSFMPWSCRIPISEGFYEFS
ncbi:F-box/kelch-repeat protein-like isoform X2 [Salvia divinorum]|uniref:F-box/kelch-repeat protein-like isoform X2 n=1 Tax=Salvia divinorum TaxID=28513 RepID=A0ABD1IAA5_SALDI